MKAVEDRGGSAHMKKWEKKKKKKRASMQNAIAKAVMLDTENVFAVYFGSNHQIRTDVDCRPPATALAQPGRPRVNCLSSAKRLFDSQPVGSTGQSGGAEGRSLRENPHPRAIACKPLKVRRLGSFTPARYSLRMKAVTCFAITVGQRHDGIDRNSLGVHGFSPCWLEPEARKPGIRRLIRS